MRIGLGILTLTASIVAVGAWYSPSTLERGLAVVSEIGMGGEAKLAEAPQSGLSNGSTASPAAVARFFGFAIEQQQQQQQQQKAIEPAVSQPSKPPSAPSLEPTNSRWAAEVVSYQASKSPIDSAAAAPARVLPGFHTKPSRDTPQDLTRNLQAELKRVGCYTGDIDGNWGPGSRRALQSFVEQANSTLQIDEPDMIQLTLVRGYPGIACRGTNSPSTGTTVATNRAAPAPAYSVPTLQSPRPNLSPSVPMLAAAPPAPAAHVATSAILPPDAVTSSTGPRPAPIEGRMTVGALVVSPPDEPSADPAAEATLAPQPAPRASKPRTYREPRRERAWTGSFFNQ